MKKRRSGSDDGGDQDELELVSYLRQILKLPTDLIHEIFCRLQVKVIARCKQVCRAWYNLFNGSNFLHYYVKNTPFTTLVLSRYLKDVTTKGSVISLLEISENGSVCTRIPIQPKLSGCDKRNSHLKIVGSCNGLLCLLLLNLRSRVIYIYNVISGESIALPEHRFEEDGDSYVSYKFGYSPSTNKFKVLKIKVQKFETLTVGFDDRWRRYEIFTVGVDDKWRELTAYPLNREFPEICMVALNGAFYWFALNKDYITIATFDLGEENFGQISQPPGLVLNYMEMDLAILNNCLCLVDFSISSEYSIWTMETYGITYSWTKMIILRISFPFDVPDWPHYCPIAMLRNGNILFPLECDKGLISYSPITKECTVVEFFDVEGSVVYMSEFAPLCSSPRDVII